jgi:cytochrome c oxidase subunit 3
LLNNDYQSFFFSLLLTVLLGGYFTFLQYGEYVEASFSIRDGAYGSTFFVATGFHGLHVLVGATYLFYSLKLSVQGYLSRFHHVSLELAA